LFNNFTGHTLYEVSAMYPTCPIWSIADCRIHSRAIEDLRVATEDSFIPETHLFKGNQSSEHFLLFALMNRFDL
jgi:hypothetical protein